MAGGMLARQVVTVIVPPATETIEGVVHALEERKGQDPWISATGLIVTNAGKHVRFSGASCVRPGDWVELHGEWVRSGKWGLQLSVSKAISSVPSNAADDLAWLCNETAWPDLGRGRALAICATLGSMAIGGKAAFSDEDLQIELAARSGVPNSTMDAVRDGWRRLSAAGAAQRVLYDARLTPREVALVLREFDPSEATRILKEDPFLLEEKIEGFGFKRADEIARSVGFDERHPTRIVAGLRHAVALQLEEGHTWLEEEQAVSHAIGELRVFDRDIVRSNLGDGASAGKVSRVVLPDSSVAVASPWILKAEEMIIDRVCNRDPNPHFAEPLPEEHVAQIEPRALPAQRTAISAASRLKNLVITGAAGTGKTFLTAAVVRMYRKHRRRILIAAPTGKAAKRLYQTLREQGIDETDPRTIHRLLEYDGKKWGRDANKPLDADAVVVDEASMADVQIMRRLIEAMRPETALVLVGDHNQLPPVGAGAVLRDLCAGGGCEVIRLDEVVRQAGVLRRNSLEVLAGRVLPSEPPGQDGISEWLVDDAHRSPGEAFAAVLGHFDRIMSAIGYSHESLQRIQVITPQKDGLLGLADINSSLQIRAQRKIMGNPMDDAKEGRAEILDGDKVMQVKNDYDPRVMLMNGDMGTASFSGSQMTVRVPFRDFPVEVPYEKRRNLMLAYAITCHRGQGSEWDYVIVVAHSSLKAPLKTRNLLYTAVTRAAKAVVVVGDQKGIAEFAANVRDERRRTLLGAHLAGRRKAGGG